MRQVAFWSNYGRGACGVVAAACLGFAMAGCSSGVSRFDFPAFNLTSNDAPSDAASADYASTSSLPPVLPSESVYSAGGAEPQYAHTSLPPPTYTPRPDDTAYSPPPSGRLGARHANYGAQAAPEPQPAVMRNERLAGYRVKVAKGDTLSTLSRRYGVSVAKIMSANNLPDGRLSIGQELVMPGVSGPKVAAAMPAPAPAPVSAPVSGPTYKVQKGDTPHDIAEKLGVDERALIAVLQSKSIAGAGLDVFDIEPLPLDHPFRKMDNVVITPHLGYVSEQNYRKYFPDIVEDIRAWLDGKPVRVIDAK